MTVCKNPACGVEFPSNAQGPVKIWCSRKCRESYRAALVKRARRQAGLGSTTNRITTEALASAKERFPSCASPITPEMVGEEGPWGRFTTILPRRLTRLDQVA